jgi:hypothetical protein
VKLSLVIDHIRAGALGFKLVDHRLELYGIPLKDGE